VPWQIHLFLSSFPVVFESPSRVYLSLLRGNDLARDNSLSNHREGKSGRKTKGKKKSKTKNNEQRKKGLATHDVLMIDIAEIEPIVDFLER